MAAQVTFVVGRAGTGKSSHLRAYAASLAATGTRTYYIVPEQFTFETERALCASLGGLLDITVCSFTSLAGKVMKETGERRVFLTRQGRRMVIRKCAEDYAKKLTAFARVYDKPGFSEKCDEFFTLCKRFDVSPQSLAQATNQLAEGSPLRGKLEDLSLVYSAYEAHLCDKSIDAEDAFFALCEKLPLSSVKGAQVIIDGFDLVSEQLFDILSVLMDVSPHITIALRLDLSTSCRDARVFAAEERVHARILSIAKEKGKSIEYVRLPDKKLPDAGTKAPALAHLEREGFAYPYQRFDGKTAGAIRVFAGSDVRAEAEAAADAILDAASSGTRFRDMAIIATDMDKYIQPVSRALRARGVPFFTDAKHPLSGYPAAMLLVSALRAAKRGYPAEALLQVAKTGLADVTREQTEAFENYMLEKNVRGSRFKNPFPQDAPQEAEIARATLFAPLSALHAKLYASRTAAGKVAALYEYLQTLGVRDKLIRLTDELRQEGELELMEEEAQVYNMLLELISQLHAILGDTIVSTARFIDLFEEGISSYEVGVIPSSADQLLFGSLGRSRARDLASLYILGASQGVFPASVADDGMVNDEEIASLVQLGLSELPDTGKRSDKELSDVYGAVTKPRSLLYLSYPLAGGDVAPCALIDRIAELYSDVQVETDLAPRVPGSPETAMRQLSGELRAGLDAGEMSLQAQTLYAAFAARDACEGWDAKVKRIEGALFHSVSPEPFGQELAQTLYGTPLHGSASRLEAFNACPFNHFARYGLSLEPRKEYRESSLDEGTFCHDALNLFTQQLIDAGKAPALYTDADIEALMSDILPNLAAQHNGGILLDTARNRALFARLSRKILATAKAIVCQLAAGSFRITGCEVPFGRGQLYPPIMLDLPDGRSYELSGRIDRIDSFKAEDGETYVRVIDYKTGSATLSMGDVFAGLKLQLPLYINAVTCVLRAEEKAARAAGMYYLPITDPVVSEGDEQQTLKALLNAFYMKGLTVREPTLMQAGGAGVAFPKSSSSYAVDANRFKTAAHYAIEKAKATAQSILEGSAQTEPYRGKNGYTACGLCDFGTVCAFDTALPDCAYRNVRTMKVDDFFQEVPHDNVDK